MQKTPETLDISGRNGQKTHEIPHIASHLDQFALKTQALLGRPIAPEPGGLVPRGHVPLRQQPARGAVLLREALGVDGPNRVVDEAVALLPGPVEGLVSRPRPIVSRWIAIGSPPERA